MTENDSSPDFVELPPDSLSSEDGKERAEFAPAAQPDATIPQSDLPEELRVPEGTEEARRDLFPVVGLGASAGGLEAFERFFKAMPPDSGMAFVIVQHLDPTHKSILAELIKKYTRMDVFEVEDNVAVEPNSVYVIPPNHDMAIMRGRLHLLEQSKVHGRRLPIDFFFRSLAADRGDRAVGVVLSGTGTEGTLGLKAIKERDGMVMVQLPESAQYDGMPRSAAATGQADFVLPPEKMPEQLVTYEQRLRQCGEVHDALPPLRLPPSDLQKVLVLLRARSGHDFSGYKQNTIMRRVERRMSVNQIDDLSDYVRYLGESPGEVETLFRELLIEVTNFFRDPNAFALLRERVVPALFENRPLDLPLRVWVAGCSTGEEAYSLAMLVQDYLDEHDLDYKVQIFATDIDKYAIETARAGVYTDGIIADIPGENYLRYFVVDRNTYQVKKSIRDMIVFAVQSVIKDPPFSKMDLIACRNLLIYMGPELQKRVLRLFHYSLKPEGFLFLGSSESVGEFSDLYLPVDRKWKIYQRKSGSLQSLGMGTQPTHPAPYVEDWLSGRETKPRDKVNLREIAEKTLLNNYAPAALIIDDKGDVLYIHGRTGKYLEPNSGEANMNVLSMAWEGLRLELSAAIRRAVAQHHEVESLNLRVKTNGDTQLVDLTVRPINDPAAPQGLYMVTLLDRPTPAPVDGKVTNEMPEEAYRRITELEQELQSAREYLRSTIEELETSNEELKSANEELQSSNEEMQSTNEELETSKEELQSVNEELTTVNAEMETNLEELSRVNGDLNNLLVSTDIGTIFLDDELRVERFTPAATRFVNLIPGDVGRPLAHIVANLENSPLVEDVRAVLDTLTARERELRTTDGRWCLVRILPYRTVENTVKGAVVSFIDITEQKRTQERLQVLTRAIEQSPSMVMITNLQGNIEYVNPRFTVVTGYTPAEVLGKNPRSLYGEEFPQKLYDQMWSTLLAGQEWRGELHNRKKNGELFWEAVSITPLKTAGGTISQFVTVSEDVTELKQLEGMRRLAAVVRDSEDAISVVDFDGRILAWNRGAAQAYGWSETDALTMSIRDLLPDKGRMEMSDLLRRLKAGERLEPFRGERRARDGGSFTVWCTMSRLLDDAGKPFGISITERDISTGKDQPWTPDGQTRDKGNPRQ